MTGAEKDKMAANFIPTSVVSFLPSIIHNNYQHIKSLDFQYKFQIKNLSYRSFSMIIDELWFKTLQERLILSSYALGTNRHGGDGGFSV